mgnify:CR=1 FL=1
MEFWSIDDYIDAARERNDFTSDNQLTKYMGFKGAPISFWRCKKTWPSDASMEHLARLAGRDPDVALMELASWRAEGGLKLRYRKIAETLARVAAIILFLFVISAPTLAGTSPAQSNQMSANTIYYENRRRRIFWRLFSRAWFSILECTLRSRAPIGA